ncbi:F-box only protein 8 like protein [Argiope bruennichi]|uniref:F-box only protein 8 like protein n=1 Tax=Argiope bruennichi TaxID=94029 RepID=A0A8T0FFM4_ARGBR|nr:F-box only protein 8 like protein [Argiope bruennichi]
MGQVLKKIKEHENSINEDNCSIGFPDLAALPPEISLCVLSHLNATDLCLAACVWGELAQDQILWQSLCRSQWGYASIYSKQKSSCHFSYHHLYLQLDEGTVTFNADAFMGMDYFIKHQLIDDNPKEIAHFIYSTRTLNVRQKRLYLNKFSLFLIPFMEDYPKYYEESSFKLLDLALSFDWLNRVAAEDLYKVSIKTAQTLLIHIPQLKHIKEVTSTIHSFREEYTSKKYMVYILCFSLIMLSVDLTSPHIKNKMSKREFIRNVRYAIHRADDELFGHMYDDVYLRGHIAPNSITMVDSVIRSWQLLSSVTVDIKENRTVKWI